MVIKLLLTLYSFIFTMAMFGFLLYGILVFKEAKKENSKILYICSLAVIVLGLLFIFGLFLAIFIAK